ncbi:thioesterase [Enterobacter cloacae]|uniref:thioesterase II family protein n=1 Tax=Enterobacter cloacae TaxID=550 RepID=UPI0022A2C54F|nr:alpha/beta fold hydrolase [Enterobacter cloacae]HCT7577972.1 thioesterase [Enterobacter cloacae]
MKCYAFGYAGSGDNVFREMRLTGVESVKQFVYPGRGSRAEEAFASSIPALAQLAVDETENNGQPVLLLGYSLGALVAYEVAVRLTALQRPVAGLVVCAMNAPGCMRGTRQVHNMSLTELTDWLRKLGGTPEVVLDSQELMMLFAPAIRADYRILDSYVAQPQCVLNCPITVIYGREDRLTDVSGLQNWQSLTMGGTRYVALPGGHFFLQQMPSFVSAIELSLSRSVKGAMVQCPHKYC